MKERRGELFLHLCGCVLHNLWGLQGKMSIYISLCVCVCAACVGLDKLCWHNSENNRLTKRTENYTRIANRRKFRRE